MTYFVFNVDRSPSSFPTRNRSFQRLGMVMQPELG